MTNDAKEQAALAAANDRPDNSPTFFSARRPESTVLGIGCTAYAAGRPTAHPWRYFVAAGESLAKIEQFIAEAKTVNELLQSLAAEVGADATSNGYFTFENAEVEAIAPQLRLQFKSNTDFICNAACPGDFFPDLRYSGGMAVQVDIIAIQSLPAEEVEAARDALAKKYGAQSFDGKFFHFQWWEQQVELAPMPVEQQFRLKSNPAFVRGPHHSNLFRPDRETDEGRAIEKKMSEIVSRRYPEQRLAQWISSFALDISLRGLNEGPDPKSAEAEKIGDEWIIKVLVIVEGIFGVDGKGGMRTGEKEGWVMPPGAKPIAVSEYYGKLEKSGTLRALPVAASANDTEGPCIAGVCNSNTIN
jgi:hypothetical protein